MATKKPSWQEVIMDRVTEKEPTRRPRRSVGVTYPAHWHGLILEAAKSRNISIGAYARRAIMAFVLHDLGMEWSAIAGEDRVAAVYGAAGDSKPAVGIYDGQWKISALERPIEQRPSGD